MDLGQSIWEGWCDSRVAILGLCFSWGALSRILNTSPFSGASQGFCRNLSLSESGAVWAPGMVGRPVPGYSISPAVAQWQAQPCWVTLLCPVSPGLLEECDSCTYGWSMAVCGCFPYIISLHPQTFLPSFCFIPGNR